MDTESQPQPGILWRAIVVLLAMLALLVAYYWVHKPLNPGVALTLGGALLDLLTVGALFLLAGQIGRALLRPLDLTALSRPERLALEAALGLGVVSLIALVVGLVGGFNRFALWGLLLAVSIALGYRPRFDYARDCAALLQNPRIEGGWTRLIAGVTLILLALALVRALAPPFAWDSLTYHLVAPKLYLAEGRINTQPDNHFMGFPQGAEMLYGVAMGLFGRDTTGAVAHYGFGVIGLLAVMGLVRRCADPSAGWMAALLLLSAFSIFTLFGWAYIDLAMLAYGAAALAAAVRWREIAVVPHLPSPSPTQVGRGGENYLILMGVFAGLALGVKYTGVGLLLALLVFVIWQRRHDPARIVKDGTIVIIAALVVFAPWMLKGLLLYQNPIYPFLFNGVNWDALRGATFSAVGDGFLGAARANLWQLPLLPISATVFGVEKGGGFDFTAGPWLLTAPFLLLIVWRWLDERGRRLAADCLTIAVPLLLFWAALALFTSIGIQTRLVTVLLPTAAVMGAMAFHALASLPEKPLDLRFLIRAALAITLVLGVIEAARSTLQEDAPAYLFGFIDRDALLDANPNVGAHAGAMRHLAELPSGSTVRLMWEPRSYYCPPNVRCIPDILSDHWGYALKSGKTPDEVFEGWKADGDDYLLLWNTGFEFSFEEKRFAAENDLFPDACARWMVEAWTDGVRYTLYRWRET